jgi:5-methylcytosine-specific restriction endonuclease McrA
MNRPCEVCKEKVATEQHHRFSQTKWAKKLYGSLIHHEANLMALCYDCHHNKPLDKWSEKEFCQALGIAIRSKTGR